MNAVTASPLITLILITFSYFAIARRLRIFKEAGQVFNYSIIDLLGFVICMIPAAGVIAWIANSKDDDSFVATFWFGSMVIIGNIVGAVIGRLEIDIPPDNFHLDSSERAFSIFMHGILGIFYFGSASGIFYLAMIHR